jgi:hypothetical protein
MRVPILFRAPTEVGDIEVAILIEIRIDICSAFEFAKNISHYKH